MIKKFLLQILIKRIQVTIKALIKLILLFPFIILFTTGLIHFIDIYLFGGTESYYSHLLSLFFEIKIKGLNAFYESIDEFPVFSYWYFDVYLPLFGLVVTVYSWYNIYKDYKQFKKEWKEKK